eukprot:CAMPEP_0172553818 /NCGR_PEP_ID=MMETSP1067-20121228/51849_1 /TAXON_ID=265564 ORGANISM="Thalassiosira punctigera, Strain Tpunct2005C2" /NCGR_SAMPLE_ID=MMETSP1067 /ASSEMBLY_ACC=CAM_ASM_000444 /LENGTH=383 /DNA_ID=CAMNT_0013342055 /DNA_START=171 /DNA_END=1322 /DNA_ORIENTATION=+
MEETYSWHEQFYYFSLFRTLHGPDATPGKECHTPIDDETYYTQADLSAWIREQNHSRKAFLEGKASDITANQIRVLDNASFPWIRDSSERWDAHFRELLEYKEKHGHCNVPRRSCKLGIWVKNQRAAYHKLCDMATGRGGNRDVKRTTAVITPDQIKLLTEIGFQWKLRPDHSDAWDTHYENMKVFIMKNGHCRVSPKEFPNLGRWACEMRNRYKEKAEGEKSRISDEQISKLNAIGFQWQKVTMDPEEKKRRIEEGRRKQNEKRKRERAENKLKKQQEIEDVLKKYLPGAKKQQPNVGMNPKKNQVAKKPKKDAGANFKSADQITVGIEGKPEAKEQNMNAGANIEKPVDQINKECIHGQKNLLGSNNDHVGHLWTTFPKPT